MDLEVLGMNVADWNKLRKTESSVVISGSLKRQGVVCNFPKSLFGTGSEGDSCASWTNVSSDVEAR